MNALAISGSAVERVTGKVVVLDRRVMANAAFPLSVNRRRPETNFAAGDRPSLAENAAMVRMKTVHVASMILHADRAGVFVAAAKLRDLSVLPLLL